MGRVDGIDVCELFFIPYVRGNISIGFWHFLRQRTFRETNRPPDYTGLLYISHCVIYYSRLFYQYDKRDLKVLTATIKALPETEWYFMLIYFYAEKPISKLSKFATGYSLCDPVVIVIFDQQ